MKRAVAFGALGPGEQLPTVKALALELTVNPNTIARAYRDLERDAIIETSPGRGSFVRAQGAQIESQRAIEDVASSTFEDAVREAKSLGVDRPAVQQIVQRLLDRWYPTAPHQEEQS